MSVGSEVDQLKKSLNRERITVRLQKQNINELETKLKEYQIRAEKHAEHKERLKEYNTLKLQLEESELAAKLSERKALLLEETSEENCKQVQALRNTIQDYVNKSAKDQQEIYRLQDIVQSLQSSLKEKTNLIDAQTLSILTYKRKIEQQQQRKGVASTSKTILKSNQKQSGQLRQQSVGSVSKIQRQNQDTQSTPLLGKENSTTAVDFQEKDINIPRSQTVIHSNTVLSVPPKQTIKTTSDQTIERPVILPAEPVRARQDREHMHGETCISCEKFYETGPLVDVNDRNFEYTTEQRIQLHSRHRHQPRRRATTPPGFWDVEFGSPERSDSQHIRRLI